MEEVSLGGPELPRSKEVWDRADAALGTGSAESHGDPDVGGGGAGLQGVPASRGPSDLSDQKGLCWVGVGGTWKSLRREQHP